jgi:hypothetical protein
MLPEMTSVFDRADAALGFEFGLDGTRIGRKSVTDLVFVDDQAGNGLRGSSCC